MNPAKYIITDPVICHGKPTFKGTRIMVYQILQLLAQGITADEITGKNYYPQLTSRHIKAALQYAADVSRAGEIIEFSKHEAFA